ncbi:MAG: 5-(carboxyamino)imidazole ribonucleotide mutase [Bacteroidota bacterium]
MRKKRVSDRRPIVGIVMGSSSDAETMEPARKMLGEFGVPCEFKVVSAHRTPDHMFRYAEKAARRGIEVIIAGAGGAAHLPGMLAAKTTLPVIGVPVKTKALNGLDSLLSIVQMPTGVPVATVSVNGSANAGLLALRILGGKYPDIADKLKKYRASLEQKALSMKV